MENSSATSSSTFREGQYLIVCSFFFVILLHITLTYVFPWVSNAWRMHNEKNKILSQLRKDVPKTKTKPDNTIASTTISTVEGSSEINKPKFKLKIKEITQESENSTKSSRSIEDNTVDSSSRSSTGGNTNKYFELKCSNSGDNVDSAARSSKVNNNDSNATKTIKIKKKIVEPIYIAPPSPSPPTLLTTMENPVRKSDTNMINSIKQAQNEEYKRSLEIDIKNRMEKERLEAISKLQNYYIQSFHARQEQYSPMEEPHHEEIDIVNLAIKYQTTQKKINRRFRRWNKVSALLDFVESNKDCPIYTSIEVSIPKFPYGKKLIDRTLDDASLSEAGIENNSIIWVHTEYDINTVGR